MTAIGPGEQRTVVEKLLDALPDRGANPGYFASPRPRSEARGYTSLPLERALRSRPRLLQAQLDEILG